MWPLSVSLLTLEDNFVLASYFIITWQTYMVPHWTLLPYIRQQALIATFYLLISFVAKPRHAWTPKERSITAVNTMHCVLIFLHLINTMIANLFNNYLICVWLTALLSQYTSLAETNNCILLIKAAVIIVKAACLMILLLQLRLSGTIFYQVF